MTGLEILFVLLLAIMACAALACVAACFCWYLGARRAKEQADDRDLRRAIAESMVTFTQRKKSMQRRAQAPVHMEAVHKRWEAKKMIGLRPTHKFEMPSNKFLGVDPKALGTGVTIEEEPELEEEHDPIAAVNPEPHPRFTPVAEPGTSSGEVVAEVAPASPHLATAQGQTVVQRALGPSRAVYKVGQARRWGTRPSSGQIGVDVGTGRHAKRRSPSQGSTGSSGSGGRSSTSPVVALDPAAGTARFYV